MDDPVALTLPIVEGIPVDNGSAPSGKCLDSCDVILTLLIVLTPVMELLPIIRLPVNVLVPSLLKYCG